MTNILNSALGLAALGLPVFPAAACIDKRPACERSHREATTDAETIARLFANPLAGLIGVPAGDVSGFDAIDVDLARGGGEWLAENEHQLPKTRQPPFGIRRRPPVAATQSRHADQIRPHRARRRGARRRRLYSLVAGARLPRGRRYVGAVAGMAADRGHARRPSSRQRSAQRRPI